MRERLFHHRLFTRMATLRWGGGMFAAAGLLLYAGVASQAQTQPAPSMAPAAPPAVIGLAQPLSSEEVARYSITIFPDGRNLPPGQGSAAQGAQLYARHCAACHGAQGMEGPASRLVGSDGFIAWNDLLRPLRVRQYPLQVLSVGAMWPYATTVFDYVRRGMPMHAPKSLTDDEVYAVTAHLLHLNGLVSASAVMNKESLPQVVMPGRDRTVSAWPLGR
ncbi:cytochrome c [Acidovorax sp. LjRoot74]|uniref:c-type cytochrome n=1 Tax=Acidovorax sp. LjRoot74 TaxID=3342337 RepID=UPI003ECF8D45